MEAKKAKRKTLVLITVGTLTILGGISTILFSVVTLRLEILGICKGTLCCWGGGLLITSPLICLFLVLLLSFLLNLKETKGQKETEWLSIG